MQWFSVILLSLVHATASCPKEMTAMVTHHREVAKEWEQNRIAKNSNDKIANLSNGTDYFPLWHTGCL